MPPQIPIHLNFDAMAEQIGKLVGAPAGVGAGAAGASGRGGVMGRAATGLMGPEGKRMETVGRGLGQIAKQLPGAGIFGDMAGAMKKGGVMGAGMAGIAGIMGFVKQILQSSKVFQGIAGTFFKIFGAMADVFLIPFLPIAMKGMNQLMKYLPNMATKGKVAAQKLEEFINYVQKHGLAKALKFTFMPLILNGLNKLSRSLDFTGGFLSREKEWSAEFIGEGEGSYVQLSSKDVSEKSRMEIAVGGGTGLAYDAAIQQGLDIPGQAKRDLGKAAKGIEKWAMGGHDDPPQHRQLGGLISGIHQGGVGGGSRGSGVNPELGNPLRNIRGKSMDVITGIGEDVRQLRKDTNTYVDTSSRDFRSLSANFAGGLRESMNSASANIAVLEDTVQKVVTQANKDVIYLENHVKSTQIVVSNAIQAFSIHLATEIEELEDEAEAQRNSILDKAIDFEKIADMWSISEGETAGLSSADLKKIDVQLQSQIVTQDVVEEQQRLKAAADLKKKQEEEAAAALKKKQEEEAAAALKKQEEEAAEAAKQEEFRINTLTASPMFKSWEAMKRKLESLQNRLASQESATAGYYAAAQAARDGMNAYAYSDKEADKYLISRRKQQYWSNVVMPAQDTAQRHSETMSQTRQDIRNVEHWIRTKNIPAVYSNIYGRVYENTGSKSTGSLENTSGIAAHMQSNLNYDAGGIVEGDIGESQLIWAQGGEQISPIGMPKNGGGGNTSNRVLNISIETKSSVKDILIDLANLKALDDASLFNSVW